MTEAIEIEPPCGGSLAQNIHLRIAITEHRCALGVYRRAKTEMERATRELTMAHQNAWGAWKALMDDAAKSSEAK